VNENDSVEVLRQELTPVVQQAGSIIVTTPEAYTGAADFLKAVKAAQKRVTEFFAPLAAKAHEAHKAITTKQAETMKPLQDAEATVKRKMLDYAEEQERIRQAEQRKLQEQADLAARRERERLEKEAAKLKTPELRQARMEQAAAVVAPVVEVASVRPVIAGQSIKKTWRVTSVTDRKALVMALMGFPDWEAYVELNMGQLDKFAARTKGSVMLPGVTFAEVSGLSSTSK